MIINGAPILHARTFRVDFRSKLLFRPSFFSDEDAAYCYQAAVDSTTFRELAPPEGRTVFFAKGDYIVVGKTAVFSDLFAACGLPPKYDRVDSENGRNAYGFIGAAFKKSDVRTPFIIGDEELLNIYVTQIANRWLEEYEKDDVFSSHFSTMTAITVKEIPDNKEFIPLLHQLDDKFVVDDTNENNAKILSAVFSIGKTDHDIAMCTSLYTEKAIRDSCFDVVTCKNASSVFLNNKKSASEEGPLQIPPQPKPNGGHDSILNQYSMPQDDDPRKKVIGRFTEKRKSTNLGNSVAPGNPGKRRKEGSLDDLLSNSAAPVDREESEGRFRPTFPAINPEEPQKQKSQQERKTPVANYKEIGLILGSIAGVVCIVVEVVNNASPVVIAITSVCTVIFTGLEAKNIIDKFKN